MVFAVVQPGFQPAIIAKLQGDKEWLLGCLSAKTEHMNTRRRRYRHVFAACWHRTLPWALNASKNRDKRRLSAIPLRVAYATSSLSFWARHIASDWARRRSVTPVFAGLDNSRPSKAALGLVRRGS